MLRRPARRSPSRCVPTRAWWPWGRGSGAGAIDAPISEATIRGAAGGMALNGLRPVVELRIVDFALCAMDEAINQAAKARYMFGGQGRGPLAPRGPVGGGGG